MSVEAQAVRWADRIAYVNHDLEDSIRARVVSIDQVPASILDTLGRSHSGRIGAAVGDVVTQSQGVPELRLSPPIMQALNDLKEFLFERVYFPTTSDEAHRVK